MLGGSDYFNGRGRSWQIRRSTKTGQNNAGCEKWLALLQELFEPRGDEKKHEYPSKERSWGSGSGGGEFARGEG